jgi:Zn-finger nucleic acid-binding protein
MNCPACSTTQLVMAERSGVEIDYCPKCRGVWLDRGELDKIIDRASSEGPTSAPAAPPPAPRGYAAPVPPPPQQQYPPGYNPNQDSKYGYQYGQPRKKSVWREMFDF